jgi:uncharacterized membrane protein
VPSLQPDLRLADTLGLRSPRLVLNRIWVKARMIVRRYFVAGILAFAPIGITIWAISWIVQRLDALVLPRVMKLFFPGASTPDTIPFVGALFTLLVILLFGVIARHLFGWEFVRMTERALARVPVARNIYTAVKQLFEAIFRSETHDAFRRVVVIEYPRKGIWAIAFTTGPAAPILQDGATETLVNVFLPTTPNPTSGFYLLVPERELRAVDVTVEQAFKLIMSAGLVTPDEAGPATGGIPAGEVAPDYAAPGPSSGPAPEPSR